MSSPIHSALFSPPPSPPTKAKTVDIHTKHGLVSLKAILLPGDMKTEINGFGSALKARSPRTPQQAQFTVDTTYPSAYPKVPNTPTLDIEATPKASESLGATPRRKGRMSPKIGSPGYQINVPSAPLSMPSSLPRPVLRLVFLFLLMASSALLLLLVPGARFPSLRRASSSRRAALGYDDSDYGSQPLQGWTDAKERDYVPPQVRVPHMMKRMFRNTELEKHVPAPPRAKRPAIDAHPLPETHEILAIQSYILENAHNILSDDIDIDLPVDANKVSSMNLGKPGSKAEQAWYEDLMKEKGNDIVVWYGGDDSAQLPTETLEILHALHGPTRQPTMLPCHSRSDKKLLHAIFERLSIPFRHHPLVMIGNVPIIGDAEGLEGLRGSGKLAELLNEIGWLKEVEEVAPEATVDDHIDEEFDAIMESLDVFDILE